MALQTIAVRQGTKYGPIYSHALKKQVPGITVLGDDRPLKTTFRGWFAKIEAFAPWNEDLRPCLYFDLDTFVCGPIDVFDILDDKQLWLIRDFNSPKRSETGIMLIPKDTEAIWANRFDMRQSDGAYLRQFPHKRMNHHIPGIYSYKNHCREAKPDDARIICFHGEPKQTTLKPGWAQDYWNALL